jgi:hypothetical protein
MPALVVRLQGNGRDTIDAPAEQPRCVGIPPFPSLCASYTEMPFIACDRPGTSQLGTWLLSASSALIVREAEPGFTARRCLGGDDGILGGMQDDVASGGAGDYPLIESR